MTHISSPLSHVDTPSVLSVLQDLELATVRHLLALHALGRCSCYGPYGRNEPCSATDIGSLEDLSF